ncbi:AMP-binding enzyme, partial [Mycobacterium tuberculosis]|uniref:AMP-binding enzyme n=1 Tax=Mycobacterium tuberculosis TaxID=1773 RepID=UPI00405346C8
MAASLSENLSCHSSNMCRLSGNAATNLERPGEEPPGDRCTRRQAVRPARTLAKKGNIPVGYYKDEKKTAETFRTINGVRYAIPGDYAQVEEDGTVTMLGRGSVSINSGGEKVYPEEVEAALKGHPDVFDALVVGVPDPRYGQQVADWVAPWIIGPMIHGATQSATWMALFSGQTTVLAPEFNADEVWRTIHKHKVNLLFFTGDAMARPLVDALVKGNDYDLSSLFLLASTAALFSPSIKEKLLELLPNRVITDSIGSSETGFGGTSVVAAGQAHGGGPRVRIDHRTVVLDDDGNEVKPGSGMRGVIAKKGNIPVGYYKDEKKTAETFRTINGVRYAIPGDYAQVEEDGTVTMLGRGSVSINSGGEKVYPEEVEAALKGHPDVFDALVVGVPDPRYGQQVAAVVQARPGCRPSLAELDSFVRSEIAGYKVPRSLWFVDEVKRSPAGKPDYRWAKEQTEARPADDVHAGHVTSG